MKSTTAKLLFAAPIVIVWTLLVALVAKSEVMRAVGLCLVGVSVFVYAAYIASQYFKKDTAFTRYFNIANIGFISMFFALLLYYCLTLTI
jgi:uncharacterized membrane protein YhdT